MRQTARLPGERVSRLEQMRELHKQLQDRYNLSEDESAQIAEFVFASGYTKDELVMASAHHRNSIRPAVEVYLTKNNAVVKHLIDSQCAYTDFLDTAQAPNIAMRQPALTEIMMRRITPSDCLLLRAAQEYGSSVENTEDVYEGFLEELHVHDPVRTLAYMTELAWGFAHHYMDGFINLADMLLDFNHRYYTGVRIHTESLRSPDGKFRDAVLFDNPLYPTDAALKRTTIFLICVGIDTCMDRNSVMPRIDRLFYNYIQRKEQAT